ncbi:hypothetical protein [Microbacterium thalli]|uniref:hypothetical protein n=1 Tax=Microbacterium thalli TaxID=3027921 RepID=UPI002365C829|nr:hypothetical protein [Microbacterium thalli]MDD7929918.1 hypothetical protein [Microbacterium thalli]
MSDALAERYARFQEALRVNSDVPSSARRLVANTLELMASSTRAFTEFELAQGRSDAATRRPEGMEYLAELDQLRRPLKDADVDGLLVWARRAVEVVQHWLSQFMSAARTDPLFLNEMRLLSARAADLLEAAEREMDSLAIASSLRQNLERAEEVNEELEKTSSNLKRASGEAGQASLSTHFGTYATRELRWAWVFRLLSVVLVLLAVGGAAAILTNPDLRVSPNDWTGLTTKFALLAGLGSLAAYLARQAAVHRRTGVWAKSLEIQLDSFPAFIDGVPEDGRTAAYLALGQRVLGVPPNKDGDVAPDQGMPTAQIIDLITVALKKS